MGLFTLTDIIFNKNTKGRTGASSQQLVGSQYDYNTFRYPLDVGNYDKGHYMVIHINEQTKTQFPGTTASDDPTVVRNTKSLQAMRGATNIGGGVSTLTNSSVGQEVLGFVNKSTDFVTGLIPGDVGKTINSATVGATNYLTESIKSINPENFLRTVRRTTDTIAFYMPDTLQFTYNQSYSDLQLGGELSSALLASASSVADTMKSNPNGASEQIGKNLSPFLASYAAKKFGNTGRALFTAGTGMVENPMLELIYQSPSFRTFQFVFNLTPRDEKEALEVQNILERLRFHQAPEIKSDTGGYFLIPPSEFDIKFYYAGKENPNIPKISTCVLDSIDINYTPNGFSAFEVPGENAAALGRTGMPVSIQLTLGFKETQILTKDDFSSGRISKQSMDMSAEYKKAGAVNSNGEGIY